MGNGPGRIFFSKRYQCVTHNNIHPQPLKRRQHIGPRIHGLHGGSSGNEGWARFVAFLFTSISPFSFYQPPEIFLYSLPVNPTCALLLTCLLNCYVIPLNLIYPSLIAICCVDLIISFEVFSQCNLLATHSFRHLMGTVSFSPSTYLGSTSIMRNPTPCYFHNHL